MALAGGQVAVTTSAQALTASTTAAVETLIVKAHSANDNPVYVGPAGVTTSTGYPIYAGEEFVLTPAHGSLAKTEKPSAVYVIGTAGDNVSWLGTAK
jgi:hypothetical protein